MKLKHNYILLLLILIAIFLSAKVIPQIIENITKINRIKNEIKLTEEKIKIIEKNLEDINNIDIDFEEEKIARNKIKMLKKDEHIYILKNSKEEK